MSDTIESLNARFGRPGIAFTSGVGGLTTVVMNNEFAMAAVALHGAHVLEYTPRGAAPVLWMSAKSYFEAGKPIRGGVPVCFPWFGPDPAGRFGGHGFARLCEWEVVACGTTTLGESYVALGLDSDAVGAQFGASGFRLRLTVTVGKVLTLALKIENRSAETLAYSAALHTYFNVKDIRQVTVAGLDGVDYFDSVLQVDGVQHGALAIDREIDRVFRNTSGACVLLDRGLGRKITVSKSGSNSTVVWNPWIEKSRRMEDFGDEEYRTMLCIEAANAPRANDARKLPGFGIAELRQCIAATAWEE